MILLLLPILNEIGYETGRKQHTKEYTRIFDTSRARGHNSILPRTPRANQGNSSGVISQDARIPSQTRKQQTIADNTLSTLDDIAEQYNQRIAIAYAAVKDVIENGILINYDTNHEGRGYDSAVIAAPIEIAGERYICYVTIKRNKNENRYYLHEVWTQKNLTDVRSNAAQKQPSHLQGTANVLQNILTASDNASKIVDRNSQHYDLKPAQIEKTKLLDIVQRQAVNGIGFGTKNGDFYYDHAHTEVEKGKLLDMIESNQAVNREGFTPTGDAPIPSYALSKVKDSKLLSILQTNASKIVDRNSQRYNCRVRQEKHQ